MWTLEEDELLQFTVTKWSWTHADKWMIVLW